MDRSFGPDRTVIVAVVQAQGAARGEAECGPFFGGLGRGEMRKKVRSQLPEGGGQWQSPAGIGLNPHGLP